jgi:hypothetical protein
VGEVRVLLVRVSVVARPTRVSVDVGRVSVPVLLILLITGEVRVLLVRVSVVALPTRVSVARGRVRVRVPNPPEGTTSETVPVESPKNLMPPIFNPAEPTLSEGFAAVNAVTSEKVFALRV